MPGSNKVTGPFSLLFASWSNDPFVARIERHLHEAMSRRGGSFVCVVEGRRPAAHGITTVDLDDAVQVDGDHGSQPAIGQSEFDRIVEDTCWFETTAGLVAGADAIRARLEQTACHVDRILRGYLPDALVVWNGMLSQRAIIAAMARHRGIPVWYAERGPLPGSWYADPRGINGGSSLAEEPLAPSLRDALATPLPADLRAQSIAAIAAISESGASAWGQPARRDEATWRKELGIPADAHVLFFPLQVDADTNMRFFSPHFANSLAALTEVARAMSERNDWFLLVKPHPKGTYPPGAIERAVGSRGRCAATINLHDALALASLVVTINSTVAAEAAWLNKPVLQLGRGILSDKEIVAEFSPSRPMATQLHEAVRVWHSEPVRFERALRFYHFLRRHYLLQADDPADADRLLERLQGCLSSQELPAESPVAKSVCKNPFQSRVRGEAASVIPAKAGIQPSPPLPDGRGSDWFSASHTRSEGETRDNPRSAGVPQSASDVANWFAWRPAWTLLDRLSRRRPEVRHIVLLGYGQNAQRFLHAAKLHPVAKHLLTSVWDDQDAVRQQAANDGMTLFDPWSSRRRPAGTLLVVTPRDACPIMQRLSQSGYRDGDAFVLCV